jgi:HlyD family secretion protein
MMPHARRYRPAASICREIATICRQIGATLALACASVITALACAVPETPLHGDNPPARSELVVAVDEPLVLTQVLTGVLVAEQADRMIVPNVNQWPLSIRSLAEHGALVDAGDLVVEFDNANVSNELDRQRVAVLDALSQLEGTSARAENSLAESQLEVARKQAERDKAAIAARVPEGLRSELERQRLSVALERAELELETALRKLASDRIAAQADIEIARVNLDRVSERLARTESWIEQLALRAPRAGYIEVVQSNREDRIYQVGDGAYPGDVVAQLPSLESMIVRARLFDVDDGTIGPGLDATVVLDAVPERTFTGRVRSVQSVAQQESGRSLRRSFEVLVDLDQLDLDTMRTGMSAKVAISREEAVPGAVKVARAAVEALPPLEARRAKLALRDGSRSEIELLICSPLECLVRGVAPGTALANTATTLRPEVERAP